MNEVDSVPAEAVVALNLDQRQQIGTLIEVERAMACHWWTMLNEMRCRGELPEWVRKQMVGNGVDHDRWSEARQGTNKALFGKVRHIFQEGEPEWVSISLDDIEFEVTRRQAPCEGADGVMVDEQLQEEVLQHLSGENALVGTNERKPS
ncbi:hypothetical protein H4C48_25965 [Pseudomonas asiatica]|uniref:hypothetical protein n=1 Tax=Pseudomonas asiatica TaxID=2219225 RepID=UPI0015FABA0C|nr:hypothetical protein [Pseudomonas asiatica]MBA6113811.1 hypothetical protein [Pseudomonas asiatica]